MTEEGTIHICYRPEVVAEIPTDPEQAYRALVPFKFQWRDTLGKVTCDCTEVIEEYSPWWGYCWSHHPDCAIEKHLRRYPGIYNFVDSPGGIFAHTD